MMKRIVIFALALAALLAFSTASAEDLSSMSSEDLIRLRDQISIELSTREGDEDALATWQTSTAVVKLTQIQRGFTGEGKEGVQLIFSYTNISDVNASFLTSHAIRFYSGGIEQPMETFFNLSMIDFQTWTAYVMPGRTLQRMPWCYSLNGSETTFDIEIVDLYAPPYTTGEIKTFTLPGFHYR